MTVRNMVAAATLLPMFLWPTAHACKPADAVAFVGRIDGRDIRGEIRPADAPGATLKVMPFTSLCKGDELRAIGTDGAIFVRERNGGSVRVASNTTYTVASEGRRRTIVANVFDIVFDTVLPDLPRFSSAAVSRSVHGEFDLAGIGAPLPVQNIAQESLRRGLLVRWVNGAPPFRVGIADAGGKLIATQQGMTAREIELAGVSLPLGVYTLVIEDAAGRSVRGSFEVSQENIPQPEDPIGAPDPDLRQVAFALWLANRDDAKWRFQALQLLREGNVAGLDRDSLIAFIDRE